jgi:hypothetical protein
MVAACCVVVLLAAIAWSEVSSSSNVTQAGLELSLA